MNDLINGINTRLESREKFDEIRKQFLVKRSIQDQNIIKPINQDQFINFQSFNKSLNDDYNKFELNTYDNYKNDIDYKINQQKLKIEEQQTLINNQKKLIKKQQADMINKYKKQKNEEMAKQNQELEKQRMILKVQQNILKKNNTISNNFKNGSNKNDFNTNISLILKKSLEKRHINLTENQLIEYLQILNITEQNLNEHNLLNLINLIYKNHTHNNLEIKQMDLITDNNIKPPPFKIVEQLVSINSYDRDLQKYTQPNYYSIFFNNKSNDISKNIFFKNVVSVELISAIFPKKCINGNNIEDYPYIILEIEELGSNYKSINNNSLKAFAQITFDIDLGKFKKFISLKNTEYKKSFNPNIFLDKFTISIKTPNGTLYNFGNPKNSTKLLSNSDVSNHGAVKDTTLQNIEYDPNNIDLLNTNSNAVQQNDLAEESTNSIINEHIDLYDPVTFIFKITYKLHKIDIVHI